MPPQGCAQPGASASAKIPKASGLGSTELCLPSHPSPQSSQPDGSFCNQAARSPPEQQTTPKIIRTLQTGVGLKMGSPGNPMVYPDPHFPGPNGHLVDPC